MNGTSKNFQLASLAAYCSVIISLTLFKAFFVIGLLWKPEAQRRRSLSLIPLREIFDGTNWNILIFGYAGNFAFFVPFGVLLYIFVCDLPRPFLKVTLVSAVFSILIEVCQYLFALGYSDIDDVIFNVAGGACGALIAALCGPRFFGVWTWLALILTAVFLILVAIGPWLGDPGDVINIASPLIDVPPSHVSPIAS